MGMVYILLLYFFCGIQALTSLPSKNTVTYNLAVVIRNLPGLKEEPVDYIALKFSSVQFSSVAQSCLTLGDPMNHHTPGLPVHHQLPEFTQTHVHRVSDAIQTSHPLSSPFPPAPNPSQHQSLFQCQLFTWGGQSTGENTQGWSPLEWTGWTFLQSKGLSRVSSNTKI